MTLDFELNGKRVWVVGNTGMVGSAIVRALTARAVECVSPSTRIDLRRQTEVEDFVLRSKPDAIFMAAARVGGILANASYPADFLYDNLMIETNVIEAARRAQVQKFLFLGSTCIYPRDAAQPLQESALLTGPLEPTNQWYAVAKIAGIKLCQAYRAQYGMNCVSVMPTNLYGPFDNFDLQSSHVLPALLRKIHEAHVANELVVTLWGSGTPRREFMHVDDLARALLFIMEHYADETPLNVGTGVDCTIGELATRLAQIIGYTGRFEYDRSKPDGTPRKVTDITRLRSLGFAPDLDFEGALRRTYGWFVANRANTL